MITPEEPRDSTECTWLWGRLMQKTAPIAIETEITTYHIVREIKDGYRMNLRISASNWVSGERAQVWLN